MGNSLTVAAIAGFFAPVAVSYLKGADWSDKVKQLVAIAVAFIIGAVITVVDNGVKIDNWDTLVANFTVIYTVANVWYTTYFSSTGINADLEETKAGLAWKKD